MNIDLYKESGFSVIPLILGEKTPSLRWEKFTRHHPSDENLLEWFGSDTLEKCGYNIGIVTGAISGIIVLDVDGHDGEKSLRSLGEVPKTATVRTGKGRHFYFRHPGRDIPNFAGKMPGLDLRGDGGYVVAPPSIHPNGNRYEWELSPGEVGIAEPPHWLMDLIKGKEKPQPHNEPGHGEREGNRNPVRSRSAGPVINRLFGDLITAEEGSRNDVLNKVAYQFGGMVAAGEIEEDWARQKLLSTAQRTGLSEDECKATINSGFSAGLKNPSHSGGAVLTILDFVPQVMDRPIKLIDGKAYCATWAPVGVENSKPGRPDSALIVIGDNGAIYSEWNIEGSRPLDDLPFSVELPHRPQLEKLLGSAGIRRWINRQLPDPASVLERTASGVDAFVSFENSLSNQRGMTEFIACWIIGTYALDAFDVVGYLWPTGEKGSGKTQLLNTVSALAYLGRTITSGSSFAAIRDEADYGATIAFDDCEKVRDMDNGKRELLLAGNMRGTQISLKEAVGEGEWQTRYINNFAPRLFSSIGLPDDVLGSRTISIPLIASVDREKTRRHPSGRDSWPVDLRTLIDDLWLIATEHLAEISRCDEEASEKSQLHARGHDIWRMPLAVAYWLETRHSVEGIFDRLTALSMEYQAQKQEVQGVDAITILLMALNEHLYGNGEETSVVETQTILEGMRRLTESMDQVEPDVMTLDTARLGRLISRLGFHKGKSHGRKRAWIIDRKTVENSAKARSIDLQTIEERAPNGIEPPMGIEPRIDTVAPWDELDICDLQEPEATNADEYPF